MSGDSDQTWTYKAFLSYSQAADGRLAPALQTALQDFAKPWFRLRAMRVFRDDTGLSATPELWTSIEDALSRSEYLILLASPDAAASPWVARELTYWAEHRSPATVLIALTDGELEWDDLTGALDPTKTNALAPSAQGLFPKEPLYVDLRWARTEEHVSLRQPLFRDAVARLAAPLHGKSKDELIGEDIRRRRRRIRAAWSLAVLFAALTVVAGVAAVIASDQRNQARAERDVATSRQLAAQAELERGSRLDRSLLLGLEALHTEDTVEARRAIAASLESSPQITGFLHGQGPAKGVAFSRDAATVVSTEGDHVVLWDAAPRVRRGELGTEPQGGAVTTVALSPDGATLAAGREKGMVELWDVGARQPRAPPLDTGGRRVRTVALSDDGRFLAAVADTALVIWKGDGSQKLGEIAPPTNDAFLSAAFSPDSKTLVTGSELGKITFWDAESRRQAAPTVDIPTGDYSQSVTVLAFSGDGSMLAWGGNGQGGVGLLNTATRQITAGFTGHRQPVTSLAFHGQRAGQTLASGSFDGTVIVWNVSDRRVLFGPLPGHGIVNGVALSPDGTVLASASEEGVTILWDVRQNLRLGDGVQTGASELVKSVVFSRDGLLASASFDSIGLWNVTDRQRIGEPLKGTRDKAIDSLSFSPTENDRLAAGGVEGVALWDVTTRERRGPLDVGARVVHVAFSPNGAVLAALTVDGAVVILDATTLQRRGDPVDVGRDASAIAFNPVDADRLAVAGPHGVSLWNIAERRLDRMLPTTGDVAVISVAFGPAGTNLLFGGRRDGVVSMWDARSGREDGDVVHGPGNAVTGLAISPDGQTLATAGGQDIILWDIPSRQQLVKPLAGQRDSLGTVAFSPDGHTLAWGSLAIRPSDELLVLWDADVASWHRRACALAGRNLTQDEWDRHLPPSRPYHRTCSEWP